MRIKFSRAAPMKDVSLGGLDRMRIATKLIAISLGSAVMVGGLVTALVADLQDVRVGYNGILQGQVIEAARVRQAQVDFKTQVQDWKDMLLRGESPDDLANYTLLFETQEAKVKEEVGALAVSVDDAEARALLTHFLVADDALSAKYQAAYWVYVKQGHDYKAADTLVRGQDLRPAGLMDSATTRLESRVTEQVATAQARSTQRLVLLFGVAGVLLVVDCILYCSVLFSVRKRLAQLKAVSDRLAVADIEGLSIDISGEDEIGAIGDSLRGVEAALHELLLVHAS